MIDSRAGSARPLSRGAPAADLDAVVVVIHDVAVHVSMVSAVILGLIEGVTEFLPVSSTGHLAIASRLIGLDGRSVDSYIVVVQLGAITAACVAFRSRLADIGNGVLGRSADGRRLARNVVVAFAPTAVVGATVGQFVKARLFGVGPIAVAWMVGGIAIILAGRRDKSPGMGLLDMSSRHAAIVGCVQASALWPGTSRSLVTILAAGAVGLSLAAAVEFSFLLGIATLSAAALYEITRNGPMLIRDLGVAAPLVGLLAAFLAGLLVARWFVAFQSRWGMKPFGYYRIAAGVVTAIAAAVGGL